MQFDWDYPAPFCIELSPQASQIDELNHVNNAVYLQWMEDCAWQHSSMLGLGLDAFTRLDRGMAVLRHEIDYLASARLGDQLILGTWLFKPNGRLKIERRFQLFNRNSGICLLRAHTLFVCVELSSGKPKRMPPEFITAYGKAWREQEASE